VATDQTPLVHWRSRLDIDGVCWLTLDKTQSSSNTLSSVVLDELERLLDWLSGIKGLRGVVFRSAKPSGFILGADVTEFGSLNDPAEATRLAARGQALLGRIQALGCPSVAAIAGYALGGGLELALACSSRIAVRSYERSLGLPEVQLGIHPGFGGTVRLVDLLGAPAALDLMLTGRSVSPVEAAGMGLVDRLCEPGELDAVSTALIAEQPPLRRAPLKLRLVSLWPVRHIVARRLLRSVARRARRVHYPAPFAIIELWVAHGGHGAAAYRAEVESIGQLLVSQTSKNLVRLFLLRERLRNLAPKRATATSVHVVGAGVMGGDIAAWCALKGLEVSVQDRAQEYVAPALERADKLFERRLKAPGEAKAARNRMTVDLQGQNVESAGVVIEAIVENVEAKRALFAELERKAPVDAILATNTSSIRIEEIAATLERPGRLVGIHFFNPVAQMPLVEVISGPDTDSEVRDRALAFVTQIGKLPLPCRSSPGFVVNRVLLPYMLEALQTHMDGYALQTIDSAAKRFGMPMGPIELADRVGLDVALHVAKILAAAYGREPPKLLQEMVDAGRLGVKSEAGGFYTYVDGKPQKERQKPAPDPALEDRLILPLVNEAVACFADGVIDDLDLLDAGVVFGTGFAPHTGGPIQYARQRGFAEVEARLTALTAELGPRFEPHHGWQRLREA
jgi:3-hydroxyacyl-CoA dehydrogenase/enoyl-CoA hydratase/3-hydroxybutyryl-CoA epimerase